tara:strand:- start:683 stop:898 length:216 start_codon:yes stop_codon:yes gene_type:complete
MAHNKDKSLRTLLAALQAKSSTCKRIKELFQSIPEPEDLEEELTSSTYPLFPELRDALEDSKNEQNGSKPN